MNLLPRPALTPILEACRTTGDWLITGRSGDWVYVATRQDRRQHEIGVRCSERLVAAKFSCRFPTRFSLQHEPKGLFARMLMRNHDLHYAYWVVHITDSCEAQPYLFAQWPVSALTTAVFNAICKEMHNEVEAFAYELRSRFQYGGVYVRPEEKAGVPAVRRDERGIQWVGDKT
jgi:hypothetical protein